MATNICMLCFLVTWLTVCSSFKLGDTKKRESDADQNAVSPVIPLEIRRQPQGTDTIFSITYKPNVDDLLIQWADLGLATSILGPPTEDVPLTDDVRELRIITPYQNESWALAYVFFRSTSDFRHELTLELPHGDGAEEVKTDIDIPVLKYEPAGEFVYGDGNDLIIKVTGGYSLLYAADISLGFEIQTALIDPGSGVLTISPYSTESPFVYLDRNIDFRDSWSGTEELTIQYTGPQNASGFVILSSEERNSSETALIRRINLSKSVVLRPATQDGPFPEGYLNFVTYRSYTLENGIVQHLCMAGQECGLGCTAAGEDITDLYFQRIDDSGVSVDLGHESSGEAAEFMYVKSIAASLPPHSSGTETYECHAENSRGTSRTQTFRVTYLVPAEILADQSIVRFVDQNNESSIRRAAINCTVRGYPPPKITYRTSRAGAYHYDIQPDETVSIGNDITVATKYLTFDTSDPLGFTSFGKLQVASCEAQQSFRSLDLSLGHDEFFFEVPVDVGK